MIKTLVLSENFGELLKYFKQEGDTECVTTNNKLFGFKKSL